MFQRKYLELFASAGRPAVPDKDHPYSTQVLLDDMAYARIHGAAFIHNAAKCYSFQYGNRQALQLSVGSRRLFPLAVVPSNADIETGNKNYYHDLLNNGACGFVTLTKSSTHSLLSPKAMEKVATALISHQKPLIAADVNSDELYQKLIRLANAYPELNIIMQGTSWGTNRLLLEALDSAPNLHFEVSSNHTNCILELTKEHFGIERVLYSSAWPIKSMGAMKSLIEYADIPDSDKNLVAHGNACRLLGISPNQLELYDDADCQLDQIAQEADAGLPVSVPVTDAHIHSVGNGDAVTTMMRDNNPTAIIKKMDRMGIDISFTAPWIGIEYDGIAGNREVLDTVANHPGRYLGYSTCNVNYPEELEAVKEFHLSHPDVFVGIKPYPPAHNYRLSDDICKPWLEFANEHHLPALIHCEWTNFTEQVAEVVGLYPNITFILAHSGASYYMARENAKLARKYNNIVLDITYTTTGRGMVEFLVSEVGADRVIFGTDSPMRDSAPQFGWVCYAKLSLADKKKILSENIQRIIKQRKF